MTSCQCLTGNQQLVIGVETGRNRDRSIKNPNAAKQLLQAGDVRYAYNANGNRINEQDGTDRKKYQYNADNFLVRFADPEDQVTEYGCDAVNRRTFKSAGKKDYSPVTSTPPCSLHQA